MSEIGGVEYWKDRIRRWKAGKDLIEKTLGKQYYEDHLEKFEKQLSEAMYKLEGLEKEIKRGPLGFKMGPFKRWLAQRETMINRPKFFKDPQGPPGSNPGGVRSVDAKLETMKEEKRKDWRARGYSEGLMNKAMDLAQEWAYKMSEVFTPPELREAAVIHNLPKGLEVADRWITALSNAAVARG